MVGFCALGRRDAVEKSEKPVAGVERLVGSLRSKNDDADPVSLL